MSREVRKKKKELMRTVS